MNLNVIYSRLDADYGLTGLAGGSIMRDRKENTFNEKICCEIHSLPIQNFSQKSFCEIVLLSSSDSHQ